MKEEYVKICPKCGSTDIGIWGADSGAYNYCKKCYPDIRLPGKTGFKTIIEVKSSEIKKFREELKKHTKKSD